MNAEWVHSLESFGTVDGPGIRLVVFTQGCPLRCRYCHNPDTWRTAGGTAMDSAEIIRTFNRNRQFYRNGGITVTGGEPLMHIAQVSELFAAAHAEKIHTCLDTSGIVFDPQQPQKLDSLMELTDLVLLDIKQIDPQKHRWLTGQDNDRILAFAQYLSDRRIPVWIRHVVVNDEINPKEDLIRLGEFLGTLKNVKAVDVLPYHTMGRVKYEQLGIAYPLEGITQAAPLQAIEARKLILTGMRRTRNKQVQALKD